jgi:excisionase family DNA binding protein
VLANLDQGVAKCTIYRAIKNGRLAAHKLQGGSYAIYPAELRALPAFFRQTIKKSSVSWPSFVPVPLSAE